MTTFDQREQAFESRFAHDQELEFRAVARRNKLIGHWAAEALGLTGDAAEAYAQEVVRADFEEAGDADVLRKLRHDFDASKVAIDDAALRKQMQDLLVVAREQLKAGG